MTNGERLRQMTDEELARVVEFRECSNELMRCPKLDQGNSCIHSCPEVFLEWLKQEVDQNDSETV